MKWNMILGALVVSTSLCSQSFGFELLDRMLGVGCGCEPTCCEKPCCESACEPSCCDPCDSCCDSHGLLGKIRDRMCCKSKCNDCCDPCGGCETSCCAPEPSCCDPCDSCCKKKKCRKGFLAQLFQRNKCCNSSCCDPCASSCGYNGGGVPVEGNGGNIDQAAPMPPAPMEDPSAMLPRNRQIVHNSVYSR